jgi:AraC-like DNA-binding protein
LGNFEETLQVQKIWENLILPKDYCIEKQMFFTSMIFFIGTGSVSILINSSERFKVSSCEMFMIQFDNSYEITMLEQTSLTICHVPVEVWYLEQKRINELIRNDECALGKFFKLPIKKIVLRYLSLLDCYVKDGFYSTEFFELKRQEFILLLFFYYSKDDLARFLQGVLLGDILFKKFVINNYLDAGNVQELAKLANYSTSGFIKKFQKYFKESPYQWMQKQKAKQILIDMNQGVKSLQEIASEYKFSSYQHFSMFCKAQLGFPPTKIIEKNRLKEKINMQQGKNICQMGKNI